MNCQRFENAIGDLARGQIMDVELRSATLAHCDECDECHLRLRDEQRLSQSLHSLGDAMQDLEAPARVETELLKAFRAHQVVVPMPQRRTYSRYIVAAVAAVLLVVVGVVAFSLRSSGEPKQLAVEQTPQPTPDAPAPTPQQVNQPEDVAIKNEDHGVEKVYRPRRHVSNGRPRPSAQVANHVRNEVTTDFMPIGYMNAASLQEGAQIIRVEMPRSALASFGYMVNMERANQRVKADVLLGSDGMAHAIRFVQ